MMYRPVRIGESFKRFKIRPGDLVLGDSNMQPLESYVMVREVSRELNLHSVLLDENAPTFIEDH
jgi:hypothetical protein